MHLIRRVARGAAACAAFIALAACENEIPTATGSDLFPDGLSPTTVQVEFGGAGLLLREEVYAGFGDPRFAPFMLVANDFDGILDAHPIFRVPVPDSVSYSVSGAARREEIQTYRGARFVLEVDSLASAPAQTSRILLWELAQPWDSATVTWENASEGDEGVVPWTTPGGTLGTLISDDFWIPESPTQGDTLRLALDSATVARMREPGHPGFALTTERVGSRLKISSLSFVANAVPAGMPDTTVEVTAEDGPRQFLFTPQQEEVPNVLESGGFRGDRSILTIDLDQEVEACPEAGGPCTILPLRNVTVNRAQIVLEPLHVPGFRPLVDPTVQLRRVAEPELGRYAPLGSVIATDTIRATAFAPGTDREFMLDVTGTLLQRLALQRAAIADNEPYDPELHFAILTTHAVPDLGLLRFQRSPRLRVLYTLPLNPALP